MTTQPEQTTEQRIDLIRAACNKPAEVEDDNELDFDSLTYEGKE